MGNAEKVIGYATINTEKCRRSPPFIMIFNVIDIFENKHEVSVG